MRKLQIGDSASFSKEISTADIAAIGCCTGSYLVPVLADGTASVSKTIEDDDIAAFGAATGDLNPVHFDDTYAARTRFKGRIAHGLLTAALLPSVVAVGKGRLYVHHMDFVRPVRPGSLVRATARVSSIDRDSTSLTTECLNDQGKPVITGYTQVEWLPGYDHVDALTEAAAASVGEDKHRNGILAAGLISTVLGTKLPGAGTIYLTQHLEFLGTVSAGDTITAKATITEIGTDGIIKLETTGVNQRGETVITGYARVMHDSPQE